MRNAEGSFYVCQAMQNIYKSSRRIRIRWLSQDKTNGEFYSPDFYDTIGIIRYYLNICNITIYSFLVITETLYLILSFNFQILIVY